MNDEMNVLTEAIPQTEMESTEILDQVSEAKRKPPSPRLILKWSLRRL